MEKNGNNRIENRENTAMQTDTQKLNSLRDLVVWQKASNTVLLTYAATESFPRDERRGTTNRMRHYSRRGGFTLVELIVAIGLFAIIVSVGIGGFVRALRIQRQISSVVATNSNASLVIEQMAREIRTGSNFSCPGGDPCATNQLTFQNANGVTVTYAVSIAAGGNGVITRTEGNNPAQAITSDNINVRYLSFLLFGYLPNDGYPPRITLFVGVSPTAQGVDTSMVNLQTTVSSRELDS